MSGAIRHLRPEDIVGYRERTLEASDLLQVDDHLAGCKECRDQVTGTSARVADAVAALQRTLAGDREIADHPGLEQIAASVDGMLDEVEQELIDAHLEVCRACAQDAADLRDVPSSMQQTIAQPEVARTAPPRFQYAATIAVAAGVAGILVWTVTRPPPGPEPPRAGVPAGDSSAPPSEPSGPPPPLTLNDGGAVITLDANGDVRGLAALARDEADAVRLAIQNGRLGVPGFVAELETTSGTLMSAGPGGEGWRPVRPLATATESDRPLFEWTRLEGATTYVVSVFDLEFVKVAESPPLSVLRWEPPEPLARGRTYVWQIRADSGSVTPAPPAPEARFHVLPRADADRLAGVRARLGGSHLARGVLLAQAGVLDEAERELEQLMLANPGAREPAQLLDSLREQRPGRANRR